jgi:RNA polymerase sigma-70 factor, ECF subfamily
MDRQDDGQVVRAVLSGDTSAYDALVERYQRPIFNLMVRMTGSSEDALDLAQDTFVRAYEKLHQFRQDQRFFPWLYTIGTNHARNFLRQVRNLPGALDDVASTEADPESLSDPEERLHWQLDGQRLRHALEALPADYREALILHYHEELSMSEVAQALQLSVSGAKMRVHRGIRRLREILVSEDGQETMRPGAIGNP